MIACAYTTAPHCDALEALEPAIALLDASTGFVVGPAKASGLVLFVGLASEGGQCFARRAAK